MPDWLTGALEDHPPAEYPWREETPAPDDVEYGDILVVTSMDGREPSDRMVIVFDLEPERKRFQGLLVTNEPPMADNTDPVLNPKDTGLPYRITVMTHASGWLWYVQIKHRVGYLTDEALDGVIAGYCDGEGEFHRKHRGLALLREPWDMRWPTLLAEAAHIRALAEDCTSKREIESIRAPFVDPRPLAALNGATFLDEETFQQMTYQTRGFSPGCTDWAVKHLDRQQLRAYQPLFAKNGNPAKSPMPNGWPLPLNASSEAEEHLLRLTVADALKMDSFVKIAVTGEDGESQPQYRSIQYGNRQADYILVPI